ncbi:MAG TPA: hypothetical protein VK177_19755 [Flavobacteriales bacterium]|nr:hypothetical protein [Flavobacteriales bacterium]
MILKKQRLNSLKLKVKLVFLFFVLMSCSSETTNIPATQHAQSKSEKLFKFINARWGNKQAGPKAVLVLFETGCLGCNKAYAKLMAGFINNPSAYIIVNANGTHVDISPFTADSLTNVFHDIKNDFGKLKIVNHSAAIFMKANEIDTIVSINAQDFNAQEAYIMSRIK